MVVIGQKTPIFARWQKHATETVLLRSGPTEIDVEIVPVVKWLNSLLGVETLYSCQGEYCNEDEDIPFVADEPYVVFTCPCKSTIDKILVILEDFNEKRLGLHRSACRVLVESYKSRIRYCINWYDLRLLQEFIKETL